MGRRRRRENINVERKEEEGNVQEEEATSGKIEMRRGRLNDNCFIYKAKKILKTKRFRLIKSTSGDDLISRKRLVFNIFLTF